MSRLVALDVPGGETFKSVVSKVWDQGNALVVLPRRLSTEARTRLLGELRPHHVVDADGVFSSYEPDGPELATGDALVVCSSGTTGRPKQVVHTMSALQAHCQMVHERLELDRSSDKWLACLPLDHLGGFGVVARSLIHDVALKVIDGFDASVLEAAPDSDNVTLTSLVPAVLDRVNTNSYRHVLVGGSADHESRPSNIVHTYGSTETGGGVVYDGQPLGGVEIRLATGGLVEVHSPTLGRGLRNSDGSVGPLADTSGWLTTQDIGRWDPRGRLEILGRDDDLIITGGENVWPGPIEELLVGHRGIDDAMVIGEHDDKWGQRVVALLVAEPGTAPPSLEEIRRYVANSLGSAHAPREIRFVSKLERGPLGKLQRRSGASRRTNPRGPMDVG